MTSHPNRKRAPGHTVTLIRIRSGFANIKDRFAVMPPGYELGETEDAETYYLPAGYRVAESNSSTLEIYDAQNRHCAIIWHPNTGRPQLINEGRTMPILKRKVAA